MNKKERKAAAILREAQLIAKQKVENTHASVVGTVSNSEKKPESPKHSVPPVKFPEGRYGKYDKFCILKEKKGLWKVVTQVGNALDVVERRFKSWYSARVWCLLHSA